MNTRPLTGGEVEQFQRDGYLIRRGYYDAEEVELLLKTARADHNMLSHNIPVKDAAGRQSRLSVWNHPGDDIYGMISRGRRMVDAMEQLLGEEVYHYHSKMILKDAKVGGAWAWHQDYGYWYQNGVLQPLLTSVSIAVDRATRENGCLQVIEGSHHCGRVDHVLTGDQAGADRERVDEILKRMPLVYVEMEPGDALFFHCNLLHRSDQNKSDRPRWAMICCYNAARNDPYKDSRHPRYTPLEKVPDEMIRQVGVKRFSEQTGDVRWLEAAKT